jgi:hypothetical protein
MQPSTRMPQEEWAPECTRDEGPPPCPVCSGRLVPLRNFYRCLRCSYSICAACDGAEACPAGD